MLITSILNFNNTVSVNRPLAHSLGLNAAVVYSSLLSKQCYYEERGMLDSEGFFYSTLSDLQESTALSRRQQDSAIGLLVRAGLVLFEKRGKSSRRCFHVVDDLELLKKYLVEGDEIMSSFNPYSQTPERSVRNFTENVQPVQENVPTVQPVPEEIRPKPAETDDTVCTERANSFERFAQTALYETHTSLCTKRTALYNNPNINNLNITNPDPTNPKRPTAFGGAEKSKGEGEREKYLELIRSNIEYQHFIDRHKADEVIDVMLEVICSSKETVRVNGEELSRAAVAGRFLKLNGSDIDRVLESLNYSGSGIRNMKAYLITALYNSPEHRGILDGDENERSCPESPNNSSIDYQARMESIWKQYD